MGLTKVAVAIFAVLLISQTCDAIKCYECQSDIDPNCGEMASGSNFRITDCSTKRAPLYLLGAGPAMKCSKMVRNVGNGRTVTSRGCFFENPSIFSGNCMQNPLDGRIDFKTCEVCDSEMCNSAPSRYATFGISVVFVAIAAYLL